MMVNADEIKNTVILTAVEYVALSGDRPVINFTLSGVSQNVINYTNFDFHG
jgi:hypothetical protein